MRAGKLDKRVELQELVRTSDGAGGYTEAWATVATLWASVEPSKAFERYQAAQAQNFVSHRVTLRYRSGVTPRHRVKLGSRLFRVHAVTNPDEANVRLVIDCEETA